MMSHQQQKPSVNAWPAPPPIPPESGAPFPPRREARETVVTADNTSAPVPIVLTAAGFILLLTLLGAYALSVSTGWSFWLALLLSLPGTGFVGYKVLILLNGDYVATRNIDKMEETERQRIQAQRDTAKEWMAVQDKLASAQLVNAQVQLELAKRDRLELESTLARKVPEQTYANQLEGYVQTRPDPPSSFVPKEAVDPFRQMVLKYLATLHDYADPKDGRINAKVPWSNRGGWSDADSDRFKNWLIAVERQSGKRVIWYDQSKGGWYVNVKEYPTSGRLVRRFDTVPAPVR